MPGMMENLTPSNVAEVYVTNQGTKVIPPGGSGPTVVLPPGAAVDLTATTGRPVPPPAPPGVSQVVLPPGGGMTPEVAAALAGRTA